MSIDEELERFGNQEEAVTYGMEKIRERGVGRGKREKGEGT